MQQLAAAAVELRASTTSHIGGSGGAGIGYGAPAAVGAALANKKHGRLSVNIQNDGDFMYAPGVLWTAAHHQIPLLTIDAQQPRLPPGGHAHAAHGQPAQARHRRARTSARRSTIRTSTTRSSRRAWACTREGPITNPERSRAGDHARARGRQARRAGARSTSSRSRANRPRQILPEGGTALHRPDASASDPARALVLASGFSRSSGWHEASKPPLPSSSDCCRWRPRHRRRRRRRATRTPGRSCTPATAVTSATASRDKARPPPARGSHHGPCPTRPSPATSGGRRARCRCTRRRCCLTPTSGTSTPPAGTAGAEAGG